MLKLWALLPKNLPADKVYYRIFEHLEALYKDVFIAHLKLSATVTDFLS